MKLLKHIAVAVALLSASVASAEVVSKVYDFENYEAGPITLGFLDKQNGGNIVIPAGSSAYDVVKEVVPYSETDGCVVTLGNFTNDTEMQKAIQIIDMGGTTGKVLALIGGNSDIVTFKTELSNKGIDVSKIESPSGNIPWWWVYFFLDPEIQLQGNLKVTITLCAIHDAATATQHALNGIKFLGADNYPLKNYVSSAFENLCDKHDAKFKYEEWKEVSFIATNKLPDADNVIKEYRYSHIGIGLAGQANFGSNIVLVKNIVVSTTDETAVGVDSTDDLTFTPAYYSVGMAFNELNKVVEKGKTVTNSLKFKVGDKKVTYVSGDENVATVDADGNVTGKAFGSTVITASCEGNPDARYTVFVNDPDIKARTFAYDIDDVMPEYNEVELSHYGTWWHGGFKGTTNNENKVVWSWENGHLDTDSKCTFTVKAKAGYELEKVVMEGDEALKLVEVDNNMTASGEGTTRTFTVPEGKYVAEAVFSPTEAVTKIHKVTVHYNEIVAPDHESYVLKHEPAADKKSVTFTAGHPSHKIHWAIYKPGSTTKAPARAAAEDAFNNLTEDDWEKTDSHTFTYEPKEPGAHYVGVKAYDPISKKESPVTVYAVANDGTMTTGLDKVSVDADAPAVYYNLQGVRVQGTPESGLYIEVKGNQTRKVLF